MYGEHLQDSAYANELYPCDLGTCRDKKCKRCWRKRIAVEKARMLRDGQLEFRVFQVVGVNEQGLIETELRATFEDLRDAESFAGYLEDAWIGDCGAAYVTNSRGDFVTSFDEPEPRDESACSLMTGREW